MKWFLKLTMLVSLTLTLLTGVAFAQEEPAVRPERGEGIRGEVTSVGNSSLSVRTPNDRQVTVTVTEETKIHLVGRGEGSLSDIEAGNYVGVRGPETDENTIAARFIGVLPLNPRDLARVRGKVTAVSGQVITVENQQGSHQIVTDEETRFRVNKQAGSLDDIKVDQLIGAAGETQDDGSLLAKIVIAADRDQLRRHGLRGTVSNVDVGAGTLTVEAKGNKEGSWAVLTTEDTTYRIPTQDNPSLADIEIDDRVVVLGQPADDGSNTITARVIGVLSPAGQRGGRVRGEVTGIDGTSFSLQTPNRGDFTILTDEATNYRSPDGKASFEDIEVGKRVIVLGQPVEDRDNTIQAKLVGIARGERTAGE